MPEKPDLFKEELDTKLSDQEIEVRLAAAVWVDDKLKDSAKTSHPKRTLILSVLSNGVEQI
jgi:hypothetical protein